MAYEIYTFGNGEILKGVFDAIAMCLNGHSGTLFEPLKRIGLIVGAFWAAIYALFGEHVKIFTHWILPMMVVINLLFVPTTSVWIHDPVTKYHQKVDHVPYGLAAFAGNISKIGHLITAQIEKVFTLPDDLRYQKSGTLFASNIMMQAKKFRIVNEDVSQNMRSFVGQCVVYDVMLGRKYTMQDLKNTDDIWGLISERASPNRSFLWKDPASRRTEIVSCAEGVQKFNMILNQEVDRTAMVYGKRIFGKGGLVDSKVELLKYLPIAYSSLGNISKSATDILKQQMMITSIIDGIESGSQAVGNAPNFAAKRAYLQQRSTYETLGAMAADTLPTMKAVLEAIAYAFFLFVIPLSILPFGYSFLLRWAQVLLWLQMWAPLYAVLNYIMTMSAKSKTLSALSLSNDAGVTIASSLGVYNMNADIAAQAGYLAMSIPFLSIALVKGVGSFVHMASHLGNVSQSAAGHAASEVTSGNFSYGNITEGTSQISNSSMFQESRAASYKAGSFQFQDGRSDITTMGDGSHIANIATSNLPISINAAESMSHQQSEMASKAYQKGLNLSESASQNLSSSARSMVSFSDTLSKMEQSGDSVSQNVATEQSRSVHNGSQLIRDFAKQNQISDDKSAEILTNASLGNGKGGGIFGFSVGTSGHLSAKDQEMYTKAEKFAQDNNFQEAMRESVQASKSLSHSISDENAKRLAQDVSGSYEKGIQQRADASKSFSESESYQQQAMFTKANSSTINRNANQEFFEWMASQPADNAPGAMGKQEAAYTLAHEPGLTMEYARRFSQEKGLSQSSNSFEDQQESLKSGYNQENRQNVYAVTKDSMNEVMNQGQSDFPKGNDRGFNTSSREGENNTSIKQDIYSSDSDHKESSRGDASSFSSHVGTSLYDTKGQTIKQSNGDKQMVNEVMNQGQSDFPKGSDRGFNTSSREEENSTSIKQDIYSSDSDHKESSRGDASSFPSHVGTSLYDTKGQTLKQSSGDKQMVNEQSAYIHPVRQRVEAMQKDTKSNMDNNLNVLQEKGNLNQDNIMKQQEKGVVRRLGAKGIKEAKNTVKDIKTFALGESQQK